ncbi:hypothetical protein Tco_1469638 [Tanacetum coccineum]
MTLCTTSLATQEHAEFDESDTYVLERFDTSAGNPVKEILLKLNLPDHRIFKDGGEGLITESETFRDKYAWLMGAVVEGEPT